MTPSSVCLILAFYFLSAACSKKIPDEKWNYVKVRKDAFMFWWLYGAETSPDERISKPLVLWIQGGPGGSGTGFGNFIELGPLDIDGKKREYTWLKEANVLFVDNPVGSGFSYVTDESAYTSNVTGLSLVFNFLLNIIFNLIYIQYSTAHCYDHQDRYIV